MAEEGNIPAAGSVPADSSSQIRVVRDFCTRMRGAECERCAIACPHDAISFDEDGRPVIDADACTRCGICLGICDAFSSTRVTMLDLHARMGRIARRGEDVVLTCKENVFPGLEPAANVIVLPCLACLSPEFWTLALAENMTIKVACDLGYCADCDRAGEIAEVLFGHAMQTAEEWSDRTIGALDEIPEKEQLLRDLANPEGVGRREAFTNLVGDVGDIATGKRRLRNSEVLQQFYERRERARALTRLNVSDIEQINDFAPMGRTKKLLFPKRRMLLEALDRDPSIAPNIPVVVSQTDCGLCTDALDCVAACPTGARFPDPEAEAIQLDVRHCIGCGLCVAACENGAIELVETTAEALLPQDEAEA